jgi:ACS family sodium-dependent inorganic phosphate cotransporter
LFYRNSPREHRFINTQEKEFILQNTQQQLSDNNKNDFHAPWRAILTSRACWALFIVHTCNSWGIYTFLTSIPKYMDEALKFNIKSVRTNALSVYLI